MIRFEKVNKFFGKTKALVDINFELADSEFVFVVGPSGVGKTTLLRLIIRDLLPTSGTLFVDDWEVPRIPQGKVSLLRRKVRTVFQDFKLLPERTIYENICVPFEILGKRREEMEKEVDKIIKLVGLDEQRHLFPLQASAGELQRASIARAIVGEPSVLLADEPTGNLDPATGWEIVKLLDDINKLGTTVIMATHNADIVNSFKKRVIYFEKGKIVKDNRQGKYST